MRRNIDDQGLGICMVGYLVSDKPWVGQRARSSTAIIKMNHD